MMMVVMIIVHFRPAEGNSGGSRKIVIVIVMTHRFAWLAIGGDKRNEREN